MLGRERIRVAVYVLTLVFVSLISSARFVAQSPRLEQPLGDSPFGKYLTRFDELKKALPARGVVGYIDDQGENPLGPGHYYAAQYALAPLVVEHSPEREFVVGNFTSSAKASAWPKNLEVVRDFGQGVVLFRRRHE